MSKSVKYKIAQDRKDPLDDVHMKVLWKMSDAFILYLEKLVVEGSKYYIKQEVEEKIG